MCQVMQYKFIQVYLKCYQSSKLFLSSFDYLLSLAERSLIKPKTNQVLVVCIFYN